MKEGHQNLQRDELEEDYRDNSRTVNSLLGDSPEILVRDHQSIPTAVAERLEGLLKDEFHQLTLDWIGEDSPQTQKRYLTELICLATWAWTAISLLGAQ